MKLAAYEKILVGSFLIAFGIAVLSDFSVAKALLYFAAVLLSALFFL